MAEQNPMKNYEETLRRYREQQARLNSLSGQEDNLLSQIQSMAKEDIDKGKTAGLIKKVSDDENTPFMLQDPETKDVDSVISQYLSGKIKGDEATGRNYRQENIEANDKLGDSESIRQAMLKSNGNTPSDWTTMEGEAYNPNTTPQGFNVDKSKLDYSPLQAIGFDPQELIQNSVKGAKEASNIQIPLAPNQNDVVQERAAASVPTQSPVQDLSNKVSTTDKTKISTSSTKGGKVPPTPEVKEVDPLEQFKQLMKLQDERTKSDKDALAEALKQRDMSAAIGMITSGLSKAGAAYGGGGLTQLKGDTSIEQSLNQTADQKIADIKERMKGASEAEKDVLNKQLTLAQMQKMRDDKANEKAKLDIERAKLGLEKEKLGIEKSKAESTLMNPKMSTDEVKQRAENRKTLKEVSNDESKIKQLIKQIDDASNTFEKYSKSAVGGTGVLAKGKSYLGSMAPETQNLESKFNALGLDTLVKTFSGMSKAVDTDAERAYFQSTQPNLGNDDKVNREILRNMKDRAVSMLNKYQNTKAMYNRDGSFNENYQEQTSQPNTLTGQNKEAYDWAKANPNDPRSKQILQKLGM